MAGVRRRSFGKPGAVCSNCPMPARSRANVAAMESTVLRGGGMTPQHRAAAVRFMEALGPDALFELLHCMRRWYSGQTMARRLGAYRPVLERVMRLDPADVTGRRGVYRGFKIAAGTELAGVAPCDRLVLPVTRNHGHSSWSITEAPTHKFSGGGRGKVGLVVRLVDGQDLIPILAPPERTAAWFNALYEAVIGMAFRPKEGEYLIASPRVTVDVVRVKR